MNSEDIKKLQSIARVLGSAMADLQELTAKIDSQPVNQKRRNLKEIRKDKYRYLIDSGNLMKRS